MSEHLKCDAAGCDHVEIVGTITEDMIGKPCPKCGANLLTKEDWDVWVALVRPSIKLAHDLGLSGSAEPGDPRAIRVGFHDGNLSMSLPKTEH
jgi:hypothetical protein